MREVAIVGIGMNKWGELWEKSLRDVFVESSLKALDDAGVDAVDSIYIGCMSSGLFNGQEHLSSLFAEYLGMAGTPATRVESACASGGLAVKQGFLDVASGMSEIVLVTGVEKMTDVSGDEATYALSTAADQEWEGFNGITFPSLYAMMARSYMQKYSATRRQLSSVAVKNHDNGSKNPHAQFPFKVTAEQVESSVLVADPLRLLDCSPITDGAASVVLCSLDLAKKLGKPLVKIKGIGQATDTIALHSRGDFTTLKATTLAAQKAYHMAKVTPKDINFAEVHDCFSIAELVVLESLNIYEAGQAARATEAGETRIGGKIPVNPSGGLKAKGHPVGATGVAQIVEATLQLRGEAGARQVKNARLGLAQNMGGTGGSTVVTILEGV
jgi:acetyl-CoA C-acetyltransferase